MSRKNGMPMWIQMLALAFTITSIIYAVNTRAFDDFIKYGSYMVVGALAILFILLFLDLIKNGISVKGFKTLLKAAPIIFWD